MSVDTCRLTGSSSILLKKVRPTNTTHHKKEEKNTFDLKSSRSSSFSKIQSVGLSFVASVTTRKKSCSSSNSSKEAAKPTNKRIDLSSNKKNTSTNSLPTLPTPRLKPSISARPFSQFFFPVKEESNEDIFITKKKSAGHLREPKAQEPPQQTQQAKNQQQSLIRTKTSSTKRHSIAIDFVDRSDSNASSRSSSLKTIKNVLLVDDVVIATNETNLGIQSDITFATTTTTKKGVVIYHYHHQIIIQIDYQVLQERVLYWV